MNRAAGVQQAKHRVGKAALAVGQGSELWGKTLNSVLVQGRVQSNHANLTTEERPAHSRDKPVDHLLLKQTTQLTEDMHQCSWTSSLGFFVCFCPSLSRF